MTFHLPVRNSMKRTILTGLRNNLPFFHKVMLHIRAVYASRYSLITGRHCARPQAGAKSDDRKVDAGSYCIAMPFKAAGYQTFIIGKWHLSDGKTMPQDKGFDINIGAGKAGSTGTYFAPFNKPNATNPDKLIYGMEDAKPGEYLTDYMSRKTVDYLKSVSTSNKPFLLFVVSMLCILLLKPRKRCQNAIVPKFGNWAWVKIL